MTAVRNFPWTAEINVLTDGREPIDNISMFDEPVPTFSSVGPRKMSPWWTETMGFSSEFWWKRGRMGYHPSDPEESGSTFSLNYGRFEDFQLFKFVSIRKNLWPVSTSCKWSALGLFISRSKAYWFVCNEDNDEQPHVSFCWANEPPN